MRYLSKAILLIASMLFLTTLLHRPAYSGRLEPVMVALVGGTIKSLTPELIDTNKSKFKYPVVDRGLLAFLILGEPTGDQKNSAVVFRLAKLHQRSRRWVLKPEIEFKEIDVPIGFGRKKRETIVALMGGPSVIKAKPIAGKYSLTYLDNRGKRMEIEMDSRPLDAHSFGSKLLISDANGLRQNDGPSINCHAVWNFSVAKYVDDWMLSLDYYDKDNRAVVDVRTFNQQGVCGGQSIGVLQGHLPSFSPSGELLALSELKHIAGDKTWNLSIWHTNNFSLPFRRVRDVTDVNIYDIKTEVFKYNRSFGWLAGNGYEALYFRSRSDVRLLWRLECQKEVCHKPASLKLADTFCIPKGINDSPDFIKFDTPRSKEEFYALRKQWEGQLIWAPVSKCIHKKDAKYSRLQISAIEWMAPYNISGQEFIAAQVVLRISGKITSDIPWITRLILFRVVK